MTWTVLTWARAQQPGRGWIKDRGPDGWRELPVRAVDRKFVLVALAGYADPDGLCWPGLRTLSLATSMPERSLQRVLASLVADGYIHRFRPSYGAVMHTRLLWRH